jgi:hypothetical protein
MKAALIPPRGLEATALQSDIHLCLPFLSLRRNQEYQRTYVDARKRGDYLILDNGCAEGNLISNNRLMQTAKDMQVHEIVAPDVLGDAAATLTRTMDFLTDWPESHDYNIMAVAQGVDFDEVMYLIRQFSQLPAITTIGIPKILITKRHDTIRSEVAQAILKRHRNRFKIHLLGLHKLFQTEMLDVEFPSEVRSMDSAQPYKMAEADLTMTALHASEFREPRRFDYFQRPSPVSIKLLDYNIKVFKEWAT